MGSRINKLITVLVFAILPLFASCFFQGNNDPAKDTFARLDEFRDREKGTISQHFEGLALAAANIADDDLMVSFFLQMQNGKVYVNGDELRRLDSHFVHNYGSFYDVLFVDHKGFVFHSIKQESDHHTNLLTGVWAHTQLAQRLKEDPHAVFVDFESYGPSGEAAAFFITPVHSQEEPGGWFVLQYGSNELNAMLTRRENLGRSGEVYLVNEKRLMLSDSRFINDSTVLKKAADTEPVKMAFSTGSGHTISLDYRGVKVFSSFTSISFLNVTWVLVVEVDADEILTDYYVLNKSSLLEGVVGGASENTQNLLVPGSLQGTLRTDMRVDANEHLRIAEGDTCWTSGVGPCTALVAYMPDEFGYLLHLGPTDKVYMDDPVTRMVLGTRRTDLVTKLLDRITRFDVVQNEQRLLRFVIVATHNKSIEGIIDTLLGNSISLSQIQIAYNPAALYANVRFDQVADEVKVEWISRDPIKNQVLDVSGLNNVSELLNVFEE